jgi:hypothetical protein
LGLHRRRWNCIAGAGVHRDGGAVEQRMLDRSEGEGQWRPQCLPPQYPSADVRSNRSGQLQPGLDPAGLATSSRCLGSQISPVSPRLCAVLPVSTWTSRRLGSGCEQQQPQSSALVCGCGQVVSWWTPLGVASRHGVIANEGWLSWLLRVVLETSRWRRWWCMSSAEASKMGKTG